MVSESQLRAEIARVLVGDVRLDEFESWLARAGWDMHKYAGPQLQALINLIQLNFAEHAKGHRSQDELLTLLSSIARPETIESPSAAAQVFVFSVPSAPGLARVISQVSGNSQGMHSSQQNQHVALEHLELESIEA